MALERGNVWPELQAETILRQEEFILNMDFTSRRWTLPLKNMKREEFG